MKLNHLNLTVTDVPAAKKFLETYFGLRGIAGEKANKNFDVLYDDDGLVLTLMKAPRGTAVQYPGYFHIGFVQPNKDHVNQLHQRLVADGFDAPAPERHHAWTFYIDAPGGFKVEILA